MFTIMKTMGCHFSVNYSIIENLGQCRGQNVKGKGLVSILPFNVVWKVSVKSICNISGAILFWFDTVQFTAEGQR